MAETSAQVTVTTTPALLGGGTGGQFQLTGTNGAAVIALGGPAVTMLTGQLIAANAAFGPLNLAGDDALYAICASSSVVSVLLSGEAVQ